MYCGQARRSSLAWLALAGAAASLSGCGLAIGLAAAGASSAAAKSQESTCNDLTQKGVTTETGKKLAGKVVFTTDSVAAAELTDKQLVTQVRANDTLTMHVFLPKPIGAFCTGEYGNMQPAAEGRYELIWTVDGKPYLGSNTIANFPIVGAVASGTAAAATAMSLPLAVAPASYALEDLEHPGDTMPRVHWADMVASLPAGEHKLQVEVRAKRGSALRTGRSAVPLAQGELTVVSRGPSQGIVLPHPVAKAKKTKQEAQMMSLLKEIWPEPPLRVVLGAAAWSQETDRYKSGQYGIPVWIISKRGDGSCAAYRTAFTAWSLTENYAGGLKLKWDMANSFGPHVVSCGR